MCPRSNEHCGPMQTSASDWIIPTPPPTFLCLCSVLLPSLQSEWCWSDHSTFSLRRSAIASVCYNVLVNEYECGSGRGWVCVARGLCSITTPEKLAFAHKKVHPVSGQPHLQNLQINVTWERWAVRLRWMHWQDRKVFREWLRSLMVPRF